MEQNTRTLADYLDVVKRRKYYIMVTWLFVSLASVIVAYNLPKTYRSTATLLIEAPISANIIESTLSQFADVQIQSIYQRAMTNDNVLAIIESTGLYNDVKNGYTKYELAELFKTNTEITLATSSLAPLTSSGMAEIAFDISFSDGKATKAKEVASMLASLFIEQNEKARTQRAIKATGFLMEESDNLSRELQEIDSRITKFKERNNFILPEQIKGNMAAIDRTESELNDTTSQISTTKERIAFLAAGLARAQDELPSRLDDNAPQSREETIRMLRMKYLRFSSIYSPSHPSVVRLKREIKALDPNFEGQVIKDDVLNQLAEARRELRLLKERYADNHPDIVMRRKQIARLERQLKNMPSSSKLDQTAVHSTNPAHLALEAQYKSSQSELQSLIQKQDYLKTKLEKMRNSLSLAPQVEREYTDLIRKRDGIVKKYTQLKEKWLDAKLVKALQEEEGQRLTIIEQPIVPVHPEKAIRRKVAISGFFMGIIAGLGVAFIVEFLDSGIRGYRAVSEVTGLMPLVVVPYIDSPAELEDRFVKRNRMRKIMIWASVVCIILATVIMGIFFLPLVQT